MKQELNHLFVYGTLMSQFDNEYASLLRENSIFISSGKTKGKLYDLGSYPGMIKSNKEEEVVYGNIYKINTNLGEVIKKLDYYEGVGSEFPAPNHYRRELISVQNKNKFIQCWAFIFNKETTNYYKIDSGNYNHYLNSID